MKTNIKWPETDEINLVEAFILVDYIHQWIVEHPAESVDLKMNYMGLQCLGVTDDCDNWGASFDCFTDSDAEWFETDNIGNYRFAALGNCPEEAIYKAAMNVKEALA